MVSRWYEYEIFIDSCTDKMHDFEKERWLFSEVVDHVGIFGSKADEGFSEPESMLEYC